MSNALHIKYRPKSFKTVVGQDAVVSSLSKVIERGGSHSFLLSGPSGCGKTTLARICAKVLGCEVKDILEIDAATYTGIDDMRQVQETLKYKPLGVGTRKAIIIDECHSLSRQAWQSLLKATEEPPEHVFWFFCTTEPAKVPATIKTRAASFTLKSCSDKDLTRVIERVCKKEEIKLNSGILEVILKEAFGSVRQSLVNLELVRDAPDKQTAASILRSAVESDATLELCRFLVKGGSWAKAVAIVAKLEDENPESVRIVVMNYLSAVLKGAKSDKQALPTLQLMEAFSTPYNASERLAPLLLSIGRALYAD